MEWTQVLVMIIGNGAMVIPLFFWNRSESRADYRHLEAGVAAQMAGVASQLQAIHEEMKDFHGRLCSIEERYRNSNNEKK